MAGKHGGVRPGSGRKPGSVTVRTRKIAERELAKGRITPLEVMLHAMRVHYDAGEFDHAAAIAKDAAPYMHPKLQAVQHSGDADNPVTVKATHDFDAFAQLLDGTARARAGDPGEAGGVD